MTQLDVLDLPQLYTKPSSAALLNTLALLTSAPPSWERNSNKDRGIGSSQYEGEKDQIAETLQVNPEGVARYLTSIVSNSLHWIEDDEAKEEIWNQASARLSGRSGRSAMSAMSRRFRIPSTDSSFELIIHEPALTGDDLGLKTWAASYLLAKRLHTFDFEIPSGYEKPQVLELGAGTGLVGLAMAGLGADVVLTDLFSIYPNLAHNARSNAELIQQNTGSTRTGVLDWTNPTSCQIFSPQSTDAAADAVNLSAKFSLILAADSLYSPEHPRLLVDTIEAWLSEDNDARVVIEFPYRDAYLPEIKDFRSRMEKVGLCVVDEGEEKGYDDWGWSGEDEDRDEGGLVTCWWACWAKIAHRPE